MVPVLNKHPDVYQKTRLTVIVPWLSIHWTLAVQGRTVVLLVDLTVLVLGILVLIETAIVVSGFLLKLPVLERVLVAAILLRVSVEFHSVKTGRRSFLPSPVSGVRVG